MNESQGIADLDLRTIAALSGMPKIKNLVNPKNPTEMSERVIVTFKPLPKNYPNTEINAYRERLRNSLLSNGANVISWEDATTEDASYGMFSKLMGLKSVRRKVNAVIDVKKKLSPIRWFLSKVAENIYRIVRKDSLSVSSILKISGWADDFTVGYLQDPYNTQVITIMSLDPEFENEDTTYERKISLGLKNLINNMSEIVIGVSHRNFAIINMNLSDSIYAHDQLDDFVLYSLIPKIYAPIKPPILTRFSVSEYDPQEFEYAKKLSTLGADLKSTDLFPAGSKFIDAIKRLSHRDVANKILDGRTGVSYGFIALAEPPGYDGDKYIDENMWNSLQEIPNYNHAEVRAASNDRWYVRTLLADETVYQQVPDIWIVTSRSGCDKTNLNPDSDIVRIGLLKGKLHLQIPRGVDLGRRDIRPSFDTYVILSQALSSALYAPSLIEKEMSILHFHGYPDPCWFQGSEHHAGARNPSLPCGTVEAALLNYSAVYETATKNGSDIKLLCLVESDHGVNVLGPDREYLVQRLLAGSSEGHILLGGKYLPMLKRQSITSQ
ncbi:MAG: non-ribosomal peptide synthase [Candidatus Dadabacteria bacterium]|nr:non-ribosomal peptide synthase [Candidatus Dadabacteria bacterium]MDE0292460.1 non-ribosomal peptide synthase [Candidatus Dadabacteria bacterium]MDE0476460.1 non-ribosomal peptide synthase [Candidatus Dadabacteria bacterium]